MLFTYRICSSLGTQCSFCHIYRHILQEKFQTGCVGPCEPDLTVDIQQDTSPIVYGETTEFYITVSVMNKGEVAFGLRTTIDVTTNNAQFLSATTLLDKGSVPITCSEGVDNNRTILHCDHTNALFQHQLGLVRLRYNVSGASLWVRAVASYRMLGTSDWVRAVVSYHMLGASDWVGAVVSYRMLGDPDWVRAVVSYSMLGTPDWVMAVVSYHMLGASEGVRAVVLFLMFWSVFLGKDSCMISYA